MKDATSWNYNCDKVDSRSWEIWGKLRNSEVKWVVVGEWC